jgi:hypothetical protein
MNLEKRWGGERGRLLPHILRNVKFVEKILEQCQQALNNSVVVRGVWARGKNITELK